MPIRTIQTRFEAFKCKFDSFKQDSIHSIRIRSIGMQIRTIQRGFEAFECKFQHSNGIQSIGVQIRTIWRGFECKFKPFKWDLNHLNPNSNHSKINSNHSNGIWSIQMQIRTIRIQILTIWMRFEPLQWDLKHSNANLNHSNGIRAILIQIQTIRMGLDGFKFKFESLERDLKDLKPTLNHSNGIQNANSNHWKGIWSIRIECFESHSNSWNLHSNALNPNRIVRICILFIQNIWMLRIQFESFEFAF